MIKGKGIDFGSKKKSKKLKLLLLHVRNVNKYIKPLLNKNCFISSIINSKYLIKNKKGKFSLAQG